VEPKRGSGAQLAWGLVLLTVGLFNKVFVADTLMAPVVEQAYRPDVVHGLISAWAGTLAFAVQIFCDFSGYSTCAIGIALMFGFQLPDNFRFPYAAIGFSDFWKRWHISLSSWLRDYLYISLGGNRKGVFNSYRNLMLTMLLGGLWHGASWNFVVWGALHGVYLVVERLLRRFVPSYPIWRTKPMKLALMAVTFAAVCFSWAYFRAPGFDMANSVGAGMLGLRGIGTGLWDVFSPYTLVRTLAVVACCLLLHVWLRDSTLESVGKRLPWPVLAALLGGMLFAVFTSLFGDDRAFIYFQF
jgi:D-alanyl-lipoteichoic acid acyltransferase DltB (MBOAT superfamily)